MIARFALDVPPAMRRPRKCRCAVEIDLPVGIGRDPAERALVAEEERAWFVHRYTCVKAGGARIGTHDAIARIWVALLAAAGFLDIEYEPRRWDAEAGSDEAEHRRPNFTAVHPVTFQR